MLAEQISQKDLNNKNIPLEDLFKKTIDISGKGILIFITIFAISFGVTLGVVLIFLLLGFLAGVGIFFTIELIPYELDFLYYIILFSSIIISFLIFILSMTLIPFLGQGAYIIAIDDTEKGKKRNLKEYWKLIWQKKWGILGLYYLNLLISLVGFLFFIIPGLIFGFFMIFTPYILILENKGVVESMKKSFYLVRDNFWDLLIKFILIYLIIMSAVFVANFIPLANVFISAFSGIAISIYVYLLYKNNNKTHN